MEIKITSKTEEAILIEQAKSLIGSNSAINETAINSSIIRSVLWTDSKGKIPIHTTRIVNQTMKFMLTASSSFDNREKIKECLHKLKNAGDLASFSKGRWLPAALKEIIIDPYLDESLLIGGVPSKIFPKHIIKKIIHHKQFRKIQSGLIDEIQNLSKISLKLWAQIPEEDLELWATKIKTIPLHEFTESNKNQRFEIYVPQSQKHNTVQNFCWKQRFDLGTGKYLCRNSTVTGNYYYIADLCDSKIVLLSNALPIQFSTRMMYAEDFACDRRVIANTEIKNNDLIVKLSNRIPLGEHTIFDALGKLNTETPHLYVWIFDVKYQNVIFETLQKLKIKIEG